MQVSRMDVNERRRGFEYQYANYYRPTAAGASTRDLYTVKGVRCVLRTSRFSQPMLSRRTGGQCSRAPYNR